MSSVQYCAIILAHNSGPDLKACLNHLVAAVDAKNILVGDNASMDGCADDMPDGIEVIRFDKNLGYCAGMNRLMAAAARRGANYFLSLNPDVRISKDSLNILAGALGDKQDVIAYPRVLRDEQPEVLDGAWGEVTWRHLAVRMCGEGRQDGEAWRRHAHVLSGHGCCFFARLKPLIDIGGFDEKFFAYQEEAELGLRLRNAGLKVVYAGGAEVLHRGPHGDDAKMRQKLYYLARNSVLLVMKHGDIFSKMKFSLFVSVAGLLYYAPKSVFGCSISRAALRGWRDGFAGRTGGTWSI
jgi:GT2 family glycosyltransferase